MTIGSMLHQTAIFKKDKMIGQINEYRTRGLMWFRNEMKQANISIKPTEGTGYVSFENIRTNSELIPNIERGKWSMTLKL